MKMKLKDLYAGTDPLLSPFTRLSLRSAANGKILMKNAKSKVDEFGDLEVYGIAPVIELYQDKSGATSHLVGWISEYEYRKIKNRVKEETK